MRGSIFFLACLLITFPCRAGTITVDDDGPADFDNIQAAINTANDDDIVIVSPGTYTGPGNRDIDFLGRAITVRSADPNDPNIVGATIIDCNGTNVDRHRGFIFNSNEDSRSVLSGFTVTNAYASNGGGVYCRNSSPTITNCVITGNMAEECTGVYCYGGSPMITGCAISNNTATWYCAGVRLTSDSNTRINNCTITNNSAFADTAVRCSGKGRHSVTNCVISGNLATIGHAGICCGNTSMDIDNCIISGNKVLGGNDYGGGIVCNESNTSITNCTIVGNSAGKHGGGISCYNASRVVLTNSILWYNQASDGPQISLFRTIYVGRPQITVSYSDVQGGSDAVLVESGCTLNWEQGNIQADPCFVDPGYWDVTGVWVEGDYHLLRWSPCIDAGDPNYVPAPNETDLDGNPRVLDGDNDGNSVVDIGAYEHRIIYVDADANGVNNGTSWADAYNFLQDALAAASSGDEIWVASGIYKPDANTNEPNGSGLRTATFQLMRGVVLKGGYAGYGELDPDARNVELYKTILSGDLDGNDIEVANPHDMWLEPTRVENSYHVVTGSGTDTTAVLDGFTIIGGNANDNDNERGGGMYNSAGNPTVTNCIFTGNWASWDALGGGGGMANYYSNPTITNCTFSDNAASCWLGGGGGGMYNKYSDPMLINCTFTGNTAASGYGGAMLNIWSNPTLTNCTFTENYASHRGGAIHNDYGSFQPVLTYCTFSGNIAALDGGAIYNVACDSITLTNCVFNMNSAGRHGGGIYNDHANSTLTNCLFTGNLASTGGGVYIRGYRPTNTMTLTNCTFSGNSSLNGNAVACDSFRQQYPIVLGINNCILWGDPNQIWNNDGSVVAVEYSDVQGGWPGEGNIDADPCFVDPGYWDATGVWVEGDYHLLPGSPCIDAGDNNSVPADTTDLDGDGNTTEPIPWDLDGNPRVVDGDNDGNSVVDMGAYEANYVQVQMKFTPQAVNPSSQGNWFKLHFVLPEGFGFEDVDVNEPALCRLMDTDGVAESVDMNIFINEEDLVEVEVAFDRGAFSLCSSGQAERNAGVLGLLAGTGGQYFYGTDSIKIINKTWEHLAGLASHWLEAGCGEPDWCGGFDLNQDSVVNFLDFALFDACCVEIITE